MASVTFKGVDSLTRKLNTISEVLTLKQTMYTAVNMVQGQAKELAPTDTGNLRGSISTNVKLKGKQIIGKVYTNVRYAPFVEFGTGIQGDGHYPYADKLNFELVYKDNWHGMPPQPFMYPAINTYRNKIKKMFKEALHTEIKKQSK